jgi:predicted ATPase
VNGLIVDGRLKEALGALEQALAISKQTGERFYLAELLRLNGEILAKQGNAVEAEHWLRQSIEVAREQQAKLFELRSATDLCRLLPAAQRDVARRETLVPAYEWFEEGLDGLDVRRARAMPTDSREARAED